MQVLFPLLQRSLPPPILTQTLTLHLGFTFNLVITQSACGFNTAMFQIRIVLPFLDDTSVLSRVWISSHMDALEDPEQPLLNESSQSHSQLGNDVAIPSSTKELLCVIYKVIDLDQIAAISIEQSSY